MSDDDEPHGGGSRPAPAPGPNWAPYDPTLYEAAPYDPAPYDPAPYDPVRLAKQPSYFAPVPQVAPAQPLPSQGPAAGPAYQQPAQHGYSQGAVAPPGYHPQPARSARWGKLGGGAAAGAGVAAKVGIFAKLALVFKGAALLAKFKFAATMAISVIAYTWIYGWVFAVGLVAMLVIHEFGHIAVYRMQGVRVSLPTFIPFFGAYVKTESPVQSIGHVAAGAMGGPAAGVLAALGALGLSHVYNSPLLQVIAYAGFFITFFNLIPLWILDGARVVKVLHWAVFFGALAVGLLVEVSHPTRLLPIILIVGVIAAFERVKNRDQYAAAYHSTPAEMRVALSAIYVAVAAICLWGINITYIVH